MDELQLFYNEVVKDSNNGLGYNDLSLEVKNSLAKTYSFALWKVHKAAGVLAAEFCSTANHILSMVSKLRR